MKKIFLSLALLTTVLASNAQVGVNNSDPKASLHVTAKDGIADGIIAPVLSRAKLTSNDAQYDTPQKGAMVYIDDVSGTASGKTNLIVLPGYYFFDGSVWRPFAEAPAGPGTPYNFKSGITYDNATGDVKLGGTLAERTTITTSTTNSSNFEIAGTGTKTISGTGRLNVSSDLYYAPAGNAFVMGDVLTMTATGKAEWKTPTSGGGGGSTTVTASNGLGASGNNVTLGGSLSNNTTIGTNGRNLIINGAGQTQIFNELYIKDATAIAGTANGKVLMSDAWGKASWQNAPTGGGGSTTVSAGNGLSMNGTTVQLGGSLGASGANIAGSGRLTVSAPFTVSSGSPGAGKVLTSDASGNTTWEEQGTYAQFATTGVIINPNDYTGNQSWAKTKGTITLPPGIWFVSITIQARVSNYSTSSNATARVRVCLMESGSNIFDNGRFLGGKIVSGTMRASESISIISGSVVLSNSGTKTYDIAVGEIAIDGTWLANQTVRFGSSADYENSVVAIRIK